MPKTCATQFNAETQTQDVLYYGENSVLLHSARFPVAAWEATINSILDWTRDGEFYAGNSPSSQTYTPQVKLDVHA